MAGASGKSSRRTFVLSGEATFDQLSIYIYTAGQWTPSQASRYLDFLDLEMQELAQKPQQAKMVDGFEGVRAHLARWNNTKYGHWIFFRESSEGILVLRILHTSMDWPSQF